jgi:hypothetical protein
MVGAGVLSKLQSRPGNNADFNIYARCPLRDEPASSRVFFYLNYLESFIVRGHGLEI